MSIDNMTAVELRAHQQTTAVSGALVTGGWMSREEASQILLKRAIAKARRQGLNPSTGRARERGRQ